jgi:hypothetical protein
MAKKVTPTYSNDEIREMILEYFYDRNNTATSRKGKKGSHIKISDIRSDLKERHGFKAGDIVGHLNYLHSQGWIEIEVEKKSFTNPKTGVTFPSETEWYFITASGIDKIEGPGRFTPKRFSGINIEAVGSVVTIGDGNQINVKFKEAAQALSDFRNAVIKTDELKDDVKLDIVTDIDSIQDQLAKPTPNKTVIQTLWSGIEKAAAVGTVADLAHKVAPFILPLFS